VGIALVEALTRRAEPAGVLDEARPRAPCQHPELASIAARVCCTGGCQECCHCGESLHERRGRRFVERLV
jgi:hypothetical protein